MHIARRGWMEGRVEMSRLRSLAAGRRSSDRSRLAVLGWLTGKPELYVRGNASHRFIDPVRKAWACNGTWREVICSWFSCLIGIGFGDMIQNRVLDELVKGPAPWGLTLARFPNFATFASGGRGVGRVRCNPKRFLKLSVLEIWEDRSPWAPGIVRYLILGQYLIQLRKVKGQIFAKSALV